MVVLGIVGGIGSGKSFATAEFVTQGACHFDADNEAKALYSNPVVLKKVQDRWGQNVVRDGKVDKQTLSRIIFAPTETGKRELNFLNETLRIFLDSALKRWLQKVQKSNNKLVILDAPLLLEAKWDVFTDYLIFVNASYSTRLRRIQTRGWTQEELDRREACQIPLEEKKRKADFIIDADQNQSNIRLQIKQILHRIRMSQHV